MSVKSFHQCQGHWPGLTSFPLITFPSFPAGVVLRHPWCVRTDTVSDPVAVRTCKNQCTMDPRISGSSGIVKWLHPLKQNLWGRRQAQLWISKKSAYSCAAASSLTTTPRIYKFAQDKTKTSDAWVNLLARSLRSAMLNMHSQHARATITCALLIIQPFSHLSFLLPHLRESSYVDIWEMLL